MCGKMCGRLQVCIKYVPDAVVQNHLKDLIKISDRDMVDGQIVKSVKAVLQGAFSRIYVLGCHKNGIEVSLATLLKNKLALYRLFVVFVAERLEAVISYIDSTIKEITQSIMWHSLIRVVTLNTEVIHRPKTLKKDLVRHVNKQDRRVAIFAV